MNIELSRDELFDDLGLKRLKESYMKDEEKSPQERVAYVSKAFGANEEHAQRLYDYSSKHWLSYSTPIYLMVGLLAVYLSLVFYLIFQIVQKGWSILFQK